MAIMKPHTFVPSGYTTPTEPDSFERMDIALKTDFAARFPPGSEALAAYNKAADAMLEYAEHPRADCEGCYDQNCPCNWS